METEIVEFCLKCQRKTKTLPEGQFVTKRCSGCREGRTFVKWHYTKDGKLKENWKAIEYPDTTDDTKRWGKDFRERGERHSSQQ